MLKKNLKLQSFFDISKINFINIILYIHLQHLR